jgi:choline transport protein
MGKQQNCYAEEKEKWSLTSFSYLPFEINRQGMRSDAAAVAFLVAGPVLSFFILNAIFQTSSRITWAFARDNGLVFSNLFEKIHPTLEIPVRATILNWAIFVFCGCIFLASSTGKLK